MLTGSLTHRFFGVRKVDPPKRALRNSISRFGDLFFGRKKVIFLKKVQKVTMGFYREERVPNHSRFDLAYSCVGRYVGWTKLHSYVFGLIPSLERVHTSISISKKFKLRAPAVHGVSS